MAKSGFAKSVISKIFSLLRITITACGLEISDTALRFAYAAGGAWRAESVRLLPGTIEAGKIKDRERFAAAIRELRAKLNRNFGSKRKIDAIVSLSSLATYSQVFTLPEIEGESLEKAIDLNMQMISPMNAQDAYSGWQIIEEDMALRRISILGAFADRIAIDAIVKELYDGGFIVMALEFRALTFARILRQAAAGLDAEKFFILFSIDESGLDFSIVRNGELYFEYFNAWRDLVDEKGKISGAAFEAAVVHSLRQVINFYNQHWPENITEIVLSAPALKDDAAAIIKNILSLNVIDLRLAADPEISPEWFIAIGAGVRGMQPRRKDKEISLLGVGASEAYRENQISAFLGFWRIVVPVCLSALTLLFLAAYLFADRTRTTVESQSSLGVDEAQLQEISDLSARAAAFNRLVRVIGNAEGARSDEGAIFEKIKSYAESNNIELQRFALQPGGASLEGSAASQDRILNFKSALEKDVAISGVELPVGKISTGATGVKFSMSIKLRNARP